MAVAQRHTRQRAEVGALLDGLDEFRSAQQLHELLRSQGSTIGLATVYRAVQTLAESGQVDVLRTQDGESVYRRCARQSHHHHLVCRYCGQTVEIDGPGAEAWASEVAAAHGFSDVEHTIELIGTCVDCRAERAEGSAERAEGSAERAEGSAERAEGSAERAEG